MLVQIWCNILCGDTYETYGNYMELELLEEFDNEKYSLDVLRTNGPKGNIQYPDVQTIA